MLCQFLTVGLLGTELLGNGESRHDRTAVDGVEFYFVGYLERITQSFGDIGEDGANGSKTYSEKTITLRCNGTRHTTPTPIARFSRINKR